MNSAQDKTDMSRDAIVIKIDHLIKAVIYKKYEKTTWPGAAQWTRRRNTKNW
ncbi:hypothetical protein [Epinotia aporema granulovirus]|uniref:Uncharacterized protein n=1 Tax=Epinotia aporema granulovirus TaxID=166056 RepID=K4EQ34_9BBAC|nr:hypothetical protein [Epinotia aporema granulovirus]AER41542.1 hypothetical protein [Epinotia aporema granulovirus]